METTNTARGASEFISTRCKAEFNRRSFISGTAAAVCSMVPGMAVAADKPLDWGVLLHLGSNMWDDFCHSPDEYAKSREDEVKNMNPVGPGGRRVKYHSYLMAEEDVWRKTVDHAAKRHLDFAIVDLGEALVYPSHPELAVPGSWDAGRLRAELSRMRSLGLEPIPKCNFSTTHDAWLKQYHRMVSTPKYYQVVADIIRDVCEIFGNPRYFHIGFDEEFATAQFNHYSVAVRSGELWWHDLFFLADEIERHGVRTIMFSDMMWFDRDTYVRRMPKSILQDNWYYKNDFSEKKCIWDPEFGRKNRLPGGGWGELKNGLSAFIELEKAGFDQMPCLGSFYKEPNVIEGVAFCRKVIDPSRLKGFLVAPWARSIKDYSLLTDTVNGKCKLQFETRTCKGIDLLAAARDGRS